MPSWTKEQTDAIYQSGTNIIVSAGAGSGKTAVLTARVLRLLEQKIHINELLILTFTKAAAAEMKERIRKKIKKNPDLKSELTLLDTAYITTFDSFALSIVKKYHYLLNITSNPKITDETIIDILRKDILRDTLDSFYERKNTEFENLIKTYCVKDDDEFYRSLISIAKKIENNLNPKEFLENYFTFFWNDEKQDSFFIEFNKLMHEKQQEINVYLKELALQAPKEYIEKCNTNLSGLLNAKEIDEINSYRSSKLPVLPKNSEEELKTAKEKVSKSIKELIKLTEYGTKESLSEDLKLLKKQVIIIIEILKEYFYKFQEAKKQKQIYDFHDIAQLAIKLIKEFPLVREEVKNNFHEIMIDEYQDTNDIQEEFIKLIANNNIYMVGDIKQSIYRFRNANPYLFKQKYDTYKEHIQGEKIDLLKNFRSRKEVLQNINLIFNIIMTDDIGGANYLKEHQMIFGNQSYLEQGYTKENYNMEILTYSSLNLLNLPKEEIEIFTIASDIKTKIKEQYLIYDKDSENIRPVTYQDFVILMDRTTSFDLYKKIFNYLKIPITLYKDEVLNLSNLFYIIKNLLSVLIGYQNKEFEQNFSYNFTSIARSFLFELSDEEIFYILKEKNWYQNQIYFTLKEIIEKMSYSSLKNIIEQIYLHTNIYEKIIKIGNVQENIIVLENIKQRADDYGNTGNSILEFLEYLKRITTEEMQIKYSADEENTNSVKIMTIHKSKGLEYPVCYFSGLYKMFNIADIKDQFLYDNKYGILTPLYNEGVYNIFLKELIKNNYLQEEISEKIRLFYVALTRAREKMIMVLPNNPKADLIEIKKCRSFADFLYSIWNYIDDFKRQIDITKLNLSKNYLLNQNQESTLNDESKPLEVCELEIKSIKKEQQIFSKQQIKLQTKEEKLNMILGTKIHEYLEEIDFKNPDYSYIENNYLKQKVQSLIESKIIQNNLNGNFYKEYEFILQKEEEELHGIMDLMIELPQKIILIDYKLDNVMDNAYEKQLKGYHSFITTKTFKPIEMYLYSILKEKIIPINIPV